MKKLVVIISVLMLIGCGAMRSPTYDNFATIKVENEICTIVINSEWPDMAHNPISLIFSGTSRITGKFFVKNTVGVHSFDSVKVQYFDKNNDFWDVAVHSGFIQFKEKTVEISLAQNSRGASENLGFNGTYKIKFESQCT